MACCVLCCVIVRWWDGYFFWFQVRGKTGGHQIVGIQEVLGKFFYVTTALINNLVSIKWGHTSQKFRGGETSNLGSGGTFTREGLVPLFLR